MFMTSNAVRSIEKVSNLGIRYELPETLRNQIPDTWQDVPTMRYTRSPRSDETEDNRLRGTEAINTRADPGQPPTYGGKIGIKVRWADVPIKHEPDTEGPQISEGLLPSLDLGRQPKNKWTDEQKEVLFTLARWYEIDWVAFSRVFNYRFAKDLHAYGYEQSMPLDTVKVYYYDMCTPMLQQVFNSTDFRDEKQRYRSLRGELETTASLTGVNLKARLQEDMGMLEQWQARWLNKQARQKSGRSPNKGALRSFHWVQGSYEDSEGSDSEEQPSEEEVPTMKRTKPIRKQQHTPRSGISRKPIYMSKSLPKLLFRCYDNTKQGYNSPTVFRAGGFCGDSSNDLSIENPLSVEDENLLSYAANHLQRGMNASPLISTTNSFLWAVHKALRIVDIPDAEIHIAVIDSEAISPDSGIYSARNLLSDLTRKGMIDRAKIGRYKGMFEWLVWGEINRGAILHDFTLAELKAFARAEPSVHGFLRLEGIEARKSCTAAYDSLQALPMDQGLEHTVAELAIFLGVAAQTARGLLYPLTTCLLQNWGISISEDAWKSEKPFIKGLVDHLSSCGIEMSEGSVASLYRPTATEESLFQVGKSISWPLTPPETPRRQADLRILIPCTPARVEGRYRHIIESQSSVQRPQNQGPITPPWTPQRTPKTLSPGGTPTVVRNDEDWATPRPMTSIQTTVDDSDLDVSAPTLQHSPASCKRKLSQMLDETDDRGQHLRHEGTEPVTSAAQDAAFITRSNSSAESEETTTVQHGEEDEMTLVIRARMELERKPGLQVMKKIEWTIKMKKYH